MYESFMIGFQEQSRTAQAVSVQRRNLAVKEKEAEPNNPQEKRGWETLLLREVLVEKSFATK